MSERVQDPGSHLEALDRFLMEVEQSAFKIARYAVRDTEEALDIVQDTMFTLARKYADKPADQWRPLFFRVLQNRIRDWHRRRTVKGRLFLETTEDDRDPIALAGDGGLGDPAARLVEDGATHALVTAVEALPERQQQAFLLRAIEGLDVAETARAMGCSAGSVKTHYSRAQKALRQALEEHW